jgi:hypothetical protein
MLWGDGMLSPGGEEHLDEIVKGLDLRDKLVILAVLLVVLMYSWPKNMAHG